MMKNKLPKIIFITGTDGAGKSCLAKFLHEHLMVQGYRSCVVWSRFHNYLSKPLLAMARLSGQNYFKKIGGVKFGFHDFERIPLFAWLFIFLQAIDVNFSALLNITRQKSKYDVLICERGPWDTLSDVMADTGKRINPERLIGRLFLLQTSGGSVIYIRRSGENVLSTRPELIHDYKLFSKMKIYDYLSSKSGWCVVDNNSSLEEAKSELLNHLSMSLENK